MNIGSRTIGQGPVYVIAEIGGNHDGHLDQARALIQAAAEAGANAAKFQLYRAHKLYPGRVTEGALDDVWLPVLKQTCTDFGVDFMCSVFCLETLAAYQQVNPVAVKIASPEATNEELLEAASCLPMLVSTGALDWKGTDRVNSFLRSLDAEYVLLHCTSAYPARRSQMNLRVITEMAERYNVPIGLSDHSMQPLLAPTVAVTLGATVIEKHITVKGGRRLRGPDHGFAAEPWMFEWMVRAIRAVDPILGDGVKRVQPSEDATDRRAA